MYEENSYVCHCSEGFSGNHCDTEGKEDNNFLGLPRILSRASKPFVTIAQSLLPSLTALCSKGTTHSSCSRLVDKLHFRILESLCKVMYPLASPQTSFGVRLSRIHFSPTWGRNECVTNEPQRTSAGRLCTRQTG